MCSFSRQIITRKIKVCIYPDRGERSSSFPISENRTPSSQFGPMLRLPRLSEERSEQGSPITVWNEIYPVAKEYSIFSRVKVLGSCLPFSKWFQCKRPNLLQLRCLTLALFFPKLLGCKAWSRLRCGSTFHHGISWWTRLVLMLETLQATFSYIYAS